MTKEELCDLLVKYEINIWLIKRKDFKYYHRVCDYRLTEEMFNKIKNELGNIYDI